MGFSEIPIEYLYFSFVWTLSSALLSKELYFSPD